MRLLQNHGDVNVSPELVEAHIVIIGRAREKSGDSGL